MLVFGPARACLGAIRQNKPFAIFNFTSLNESINYLNRLVMPADWSSISYEQYRAAYYRYLITDDYAFVQLMNIMIPLEEGIDVFICIDTSTLNSVVSWLNDLLMEFIQDRYGYTAVIINEASDIDSFNSGDYGFNVPGIMAMDQDRTRYTIECEKQRLLTGGKSYADYPI